MIAWCVFPHIYRQQPKSRIPIPRGARRNSRNEQAPSQAPPRSSSSQDGASTQATAKKVREATIAASPAARMRGSSPPSTKVPSSSRPTSTRGTGEQGYHEMTKPFLKLVGMIEEMEAKIVGLQTSNTQQAKELVRRTYATENVHRPRTRTTVNPSIFQCGFMSFRKCTWAFPSIWLLIARTAVNVTRLRLGLFLDGQIFQLHKLHST